MDPPPTRSEGNLCLLGDAALPFLPHIGQVAACALKDAASLTAIFHVGTRSKDIPEKLELYEPKNFVPYPGSWVATLNQVTRTRVYRNAMTTTYFPSIFGYDESNHTTQKLRETLYKISLHHWSMPTAFGPNPMQSKTSLRST